MVGIAPFCGMVTFSFLFLANAAIAQQSPENIKDTAAKCGNADFLSTCPNTCAPRCNKDTTFFRNNRNACIVAVRAQLGSDPKVCQDDKVPDPVNACILRSRTLIRKVPKPVTQQPKLLKIYEAFFKDESNCSPSPEALIAMYNCIDVEASSLTKAYKELGPLEINVKDKIQLMKARCEINDTRMDTIFVGAERLRVRAEDLTAQLGKVSECRRTYDDWLGTRGEICKDRPEFSGCESVIGSYRHIIDEQLKTAKGRDRRIQSLLSGLRANLEAIFSLSIMPTIPKNICENLENEGKKSG